MTYTVTITSADGGESSYPCFGQTEAAVPIYAAAVVALNADDPDATVTVSKDGCKMDAPATVGDLLGKDL